MEYNKYRDLVEKYYQKDSRELNFQNRVIIPFLESLLPEEYEVVDSSTLYKNWNRYTDDEGNGICRGKFAEKYTPDLLILKEWKLFAEKKNKPSIIIEVKRPTAKDKKHAEKEVQEYLTKADHVILTDCITWEFYEKHDNQKPQEIICLSQDESFVCKRGLIAERTIMWKDDEDVWATDLKNMIKSLIKK